MNKNPQINNPVAKNLLDSYNYGKLFENELVDALLNKITANALEVFKILIFDIAPKRDRNPEATRAKLSLMANAKNIKELSSILTNDTMDVDVVNSKYAEAKRLYQLSLEKFAEALERGVEISKEKEEGILAYAKNAAQKLQNSFDNRAKEYQAELDSKTQNSSAESFYFSDDILNENGLFTGYKGRVDSLRKMLVNLISSSEGKDGKNGYGRDWKRTFLDLDEKRKALDNGRGGFGEKDKRSLDELEKQVEKFRLDFLTASNKSIDNDLLKIQNDEEIKGSYSDVTDLATEALELKTRADAQRSIAIGEIGDDHKMKEGDFIKTLFPLKRGDTDADDKIKESGLIAAIQTAIANGIKSAGTLLRSKGGPNGKYGPATTSIIATIQKSIGNKNTNGSLDQALLDDIISSDWVSEKDKAGIQKSLDIIRGKMHESNTGVMKFGDFLDIVVNEGKIIINNADFEKELANQYKDITGNDMTRAASNKIGDNEGDDITGSAGKEVDKLASSLRKNYNLKVEGSDFIRNDGSLKPAYDTKFIKAWNSALVATAETPKDYSYFFFNNGLYNINLASTSLKFPCNWERFEKLDESDDPLVFFNNYLKGWATFGMIRPAERYNGISSILAMKDKLKVPGVYNKMDLTIANKVTPFIKFDNLKGGIKEAFKILTHDDDWGADEFVAFNNLLVSVANAISFDGEKFISCLKWLNDDELKYRTEKIANDSIITSGSVDVGKTVLGFAGSKIINNSISSYENVEIKRGLKSHKDVSSLDPFLNYGGSRGARKALCKNCEYIGSEIYPGIKVHLQRMNMVKFSDFPNDSKGFKCKEVK